MIRTSKPSITLLEKEYVYKALDASDVGVGEYISKFEQAWADYNKYKYGIACNSGTTALHLALMALGIGEGDEVIVPEFTMAATAFAVSYTGATPVFVDCRDDLNIDPSKIKITPRTKAIIVVPIYGRPVCESLYDLGVPVIEDMAEAHGIMPKGDIACYSFHSSKILTTGGGGMCLTNNMFLADEMRKLCHLYLNKEMTMLHEKIGYNYRLSNVQAAIGLAQVERIEELLEKRQKIASWYDKYIPEKYKRPKRDVVWVYDIDCGDFQKQTKKRLEEFGYESRYGFKPMSMQPIYNGEYEQLNAYRWSKRLLYIPLYPELTEEEVIKICNVLK